MRTLTIAAVALILGVNGLFCDGFTAHVLPKRTRYTALHTFDSGNNEDVFILSIDGILASSARQRSYMAICVALVVWPTLELNMQELGMNAKQFNCANINSDIDDSCEWLIQKLSALASITQQGNNADSMLGCDSVLLTRLLLEEQLLDGGRSNGRGGKYGGKFHPTLSLEDNEPSKEGRSKVGSRPLTVGEIYANWKELRDVTCMRYPYIEERSDGIPMMKDPVSEIRRELLKQSYSSMDHSEMQTLSVPCWRKSLAHDVLFDSSTGNGDSIELRKNTILLLGHSSQLPSVIKSLSLLGYVLDIKSDVDIPERDALIESMCREEEGDKSYGEIKVIVTTSDKAQTRRRLCQNGLLLIIPNAAKDETHSDMIKQIITDSEDNTNIFVAHSSIEVLRECKSFLGDDVPRLSNGLSRCILPQSNTTVTLTLPEWSDYVHLTERNGVEMDPWLNLLSEEQLLEFISAKVLVSR